MADYLDIRLKRSSSDAKTAEDDRPAADRLGMILRSNRPERRSRFNRKHSRQSRFNRFRTTAPPTFRVTVTPKRVRSPGPGPYTRRKCRFQTFPPWFESRTNSARLRNLSALVNEYDANDPSD